MSLYLDNKYIKLVSSRLRNFTYKKENLYNFSCCFCGDSKSNKRRARGFVYKAGDSLRYICHNCDHRCSVLDLVKHLDISLFKEYCFELYRDKEEDRNIIIRDKISTYTYFNTRKKYKNGVLLSSLTKYHKCISYLDTRKIPSDIYNTWYYAEDYESFIEEFFEVSPKTKEKSSRVIIPIVRDSVIVGLIGRDINGTSRMKYVFVRKPGYEGDLFYIPRELNTKESIRIVEGQIDSIFIKNSIAVGGSALIKAARYYNKSNIVLIYDNDCRNRDIVSLVKRSIEDGYNVVIWPSDIKYKDINELIVSGWTENDLEQFIVNNTSNGLVAMMKFNVWKKV